MIVKFRGLLRVVALRIKYAILVHVYKMDISSTARISYGAILDKTNPKGIHIAGETYVASGAIVFSHDFSRGLHKDTFIGKKCFIGANSIIMCGVVIGDEVIVGAGSVVTKDVPSGCIVAGNPARIIRDGIHTEKYGKLQQINHNG